MSKSKHKKVREASSGVLLTPCPRLREGSSRRVLIIGGGAAGMAAGISAARQGAQVTILEGNARLGKKLLMTGNGRCNFTNLAAAPACYLGADKVFLEAVLSAFPPEAAIRFFREIGIEPKLRGTYAYPRSDEAASLLYALQDALQYLGVELVCGAKVKAITYCGMDASGGIAHAGNAQGLHSMESSGKEDAGRGRSMTRMECGSGTSGDGRGALDAAGARGFLVYTDRGDFEASAVILATGGMAAPATGSDGAGYGLAASLGHRIVPPLPVLSALRTGQGAGGFCQNWKGVRVMAYAALLLDGEAAASEYGELQLTDYGVSGIPAFQLSRLASRAIQAGQKAELEICFLPWLYFENCENTGKKDFSEDRAAAHLPSAFRASAFPEKDIPKETLREMGIFLSERGEGLAVQALCRRRELLRDRMACDFLNGLLPLKLAAVLLDLAGMAKARKGAGGQRVSAISDGQILRLARLCCRFRLAVREVNAFPHAQCTAGGVSAGDVSAPSMESKIVPGLYFAGEILDVDGPCGGYNLHFAWASAYLAGCAAAQYLKTFCRHT